MPPNGESTRWTVLGDPTEAALLVAARKGGLDLDVAAQQMPRIRELPFDSRRKRMTTIHQDKRGHIALIKGAPKEVLDLCTHRQIRGVREPLDEAQRTAILAANDAYARESLRVLAMATRTVPENVDTTTAAAVETELTFLGLAAMADPPRPEVAAAVEACHRAGIRIVMITGDYGLTAESIARKIGIVRGAQPRIVTIVQITAILYIFVTRITT